MSVTARNSAATRQRVPYLRTIREGLGLLRGRGRTFALAMGVQFIAALLQGVGDPLALKLLIDSIQDANRRRFLILAGTLVLIYTGLRVLGFLATIFTQRVKNGVLKDLLGEMLKSYYKLPYEKVARKEQGYFISRVYDEPAKTGQVVDLLSQLFTTLVVGVGAVAVCIFFSWQVSAILALVVPVLLALANRYGRRIRAVTTQENEDEALLRGEVSRAVNSYKAVRLFGLDRPLFRGIDSRAQRYLSTTYERIRISTLFQMVSSTFLSYSEMSVMVVSAFFVLNGQMTIGGLFGFMTAYGRVVNSARGLSNLLPALAKTSAYLDRFKEFKALASEAASPDPGYSGVEIRGAYISYDQEPVLEDLDLTIEPGERILITGPNGSGKSTLAHLLCSFLRLKNGEARLPGLRRTSALLMETGFISGDGFANLDFGHLSVGRLRLAESLVDRFDLRSVMSRDPVTYSAGQQRKLEIVRALVKEADLYIFDEPLENLDEKSKEEVFESILTLTKDKTLVVVQHGEEKRRDAFHRIIHIDNHLAVARTA